MALSHSYCRTILQYHKIAQRQGAITVILWCNARVVSVSYSMKSATQEMNGTEKFL